MIKNKQMLFFSIILLLMTMVLSFPFPHDYPFGEVIITGLHIPTKFANGFQTVGVVSLFLLIAGLYLLANSMEKFRVRIVVIAILILFFLPAFSVNIFQKTFATGIYTISYEGGHCSFDMAGEDTLHGDCELTLKNNSNDDVQFTVTFDEDPLFENDTPIVSLMNNKAPHHVTLSSKESRHIHIETDIDVSDMENHIEQGEASDVNITIESNGESRHL